MHRVHVVGSAPKDEPMADPLWSDYKLVSTLECRTFRDLILRTQGQEPTGCYLTIRNQKVVLVLEDLESDGVSEYISALDGCIPTRWDTRALRHMARGLQRFGYLSWSDESESFGDDVRGWYEKAREVCNLSKS
jgi:hypothetical protein